MRTLLPLASLALVIVVSSGAFAGGGAETTLVVVNGGSALSREVAHRYCAMRGIPASHVCVVDGVPGIEVITLEHFRAAIGEPVLAFLKERGLEGQIDLVTYSADFPYAVRFKKRPDGDGNGRWFIGNQASLTGATYFLRDAMADRPFWRPDANPYFRLKTPKLTDDDRTEIKRASGAMQGRRFDEAARILEGLVARHPGNPALSFHFARCLAQTGRTDDALAALAQAVGNGFPPAQARRDALLAPLRRHPRFRQALQAEVTNRAALGPAGGFSSAEHGHFLSTMLGYTGPRGNTRAEILRYLKAAAESDATRPQGTVYFCRNKDVRTRTRLAHFDDAVRRLRALGGKAEIVEGNLPKERTDVLGVLAGIAGFNWKKSKSRILGGAICEHLTSHGGNFRSKGQTKLSEFLRHGAAGASGTVQEPLALQWKFPVAHLHVFYAEGHSLAEAFFQSVHGPYQLLVCGDGLARPFMERVEVDPGAPDGPLQGTVEFAPGVRDGDARFELWVDGLRQEGLTLDTTKLDDGHHDIRIVAVTGTVDSRSYARVEAEVRNGPARRPSRQEGRVRGAKDHELLWGGRPVDPERLDALGPGPVRLQWRSVFADGPGYRGPFFVRELPVRPNGRPGPAPETMLPGLKGFRIGDGGQRVPVVVDPAGDLPAAKRYELAGRLALPDGELFQLGARGRGTLTVGGEGLPLNGWRPVLAGPGTRLELVYEPKGKPRLELFVNGDVVLRPARFVHAGDPPTKRAPELDEKLLDGKREGQEVPVPEDGLAIEWRRTERRVISVTLFGEKLPAQWTLAATTGRRPREVDDVTVIRGPGFVQLRLPRDRSVKRMLVTPKGAAKLAEVVVGVEPR